MQLRSVPNFNCSDFNPNTLDFTLLGRKSARICGIIANPNPVEASNWSLHYNSAIWFVPCFSGIDLS